MRRFTPNPRGQALVMAMIVVVLITLLVAGAISFTGTERAASEVQTQEDQMSSCVQAARNLFLSKLEMTMQSIPDPLNPLDETKKVLPIRIDENLRGTILKTGHLGEVASLSARKVTALADPLAGVNDITMVTGSTPEPVFYTVTAVCRETQDLASPEREIEFMVRVGL